MFRILSGIFVSQRRRIFSNCRVAQSLDFYVVFCTLFICWSYFSFFRHWVLILIRLIISMSLWYHLPLFSWTIVFYCLSLQDGGRHLVYLKYKINFRTEIVQFKVSVSVYDMMGKQYLRLQNLNSAITRLTDFCGKYLMQCQNKNIRN